MGDLYSHNLKWDCLPLKYLSNRCQNDTEYDNLIQVSVYIVTLDFLGSNSADALVSQAG